MLRTALSTGGAELAQIAPEIKELIPELEPLPLLDPESARFSLYQAMSRFLRQLAAVRPIAVMLDDLHWADPSSLELLAFVATEITNSRLLVVATYRNVDPNIAAPLADTLVELTRRSNVRRLDLVGLDRRGLSRLLSAAGTEPSDEMLTTVHRRTQGNPFFVTEILSLSSDAMSIEPRAARAIPAGVKGVIRHRVAHLPESTEHSVRAASVLGQDFELAVLAGTLGIDGATLLEQLEPAIRAGILANSPDSAARFCFSHGLVNETVYDDMGGAQRRADALPRGRGARNSTR